MSGVWVKRTQNFGGGELSISLEGNAAPNGEVEEIARLDRIILGEMCDVRVHLEKGTTTLVEPAQKEPAQKKPAQKKPAQKKPAQKKPAQKKPKLVLQPAEDTGEGDSRDVKELRQLVLGYAFNTPEALAAKQAAGLADDAERGKLMSELKRKYVVPFIQTALALDVPGFNELSAERLEAILTALQGSVEETK